MNNTDSKRRTVTITLIAVFLIVVMCLFGAVIGGYVGSEKSAKASLTVNDAQAEIIAKAVVSVGLREYTVRKVEKSLEWENKGFRPKNAYYVYEVELIDKRNGDDIEVYIDGRSGAVINIDR